MKSRPARYSPQYFSDIQSAFKPIGKAARKFSSLVQQAKRSIPLQRPNRAGNSGLSPIATGVSDIEQRANKPSLSFPENTHIAKSPKEFESSCDLIVDQMSTLLSYISKLDGSLRELNHIENGINTHKSLTEHQAKALLENLELTRCDLTAQKGSKLYELFQLGRILKDNPKEIQGYTKLTPDARKDILVAAIDKAREIEREASKFVD